MSISFHCSLVFYRTTIDRVMRIQYQDKITSKRQDYHKTKISHKTKWIIKGIVQSETHCVIYSPSWVLNP